MIIKPTMTTDFYYQLDRRSGKMVKRPKLLSDIKESLNKRIDKLKLRRKK